METIVVADPRPPTAQVDLSAPEWVAPGTDVAATISASSLIGAQVARANMTLTWVLNRVWTAAVLSTDTSADSGTPQQLRMPRTPNTPPPPQSRPVRLKPATQPVRHDRGDD